MKKSITFLTIAYLVVVSTTIVSAQEEESPITTGFDIYTSYIWRGLKFGNGPAFQPYVDFTKGNLSIGSWGSVNSGGLSDITGLTLPEAFEMDIYLSYSFDFGLGITLTDYYFGGKWFDFDPNHWIEPSVSYEIGDLSFLGAYMFAPDFSGGDVYFEGAYSFGAADVTLGLGNGAYTGGGFMVCNLSLGTSKEIKITDNFSLPVSGSVTLNPSNAGGLYITAGVSF